MLLTPAQIQKLHSLGINPENTMPPAPRIPQGIGASEPTQKISIPLKNTKSSVIPLLSISGLTLLSFGSLILLKNKSQTSVTLTPLDVADPAPSGNAVYPTGTQIPKSIQHYLLASQQLFSQALQLQQNKQSDQSQIIDLLNQSILSATDAVNAFPKDHRGYFQRAAIYQALADSQPQFIDTAIADLTIALKLNPNSADTTRQLASLFAKKGDAQNTLNYLAQTVTLEPTKAQNFYDLAQIQQQVGLIPQALDTYNQLLPLITDPTQIADLKSQVIALENLSKQTSAEGTPLDPEEHRGSIGAPTGTLIPSGKLLEANSLASGLVIATPEDDNRQIKIDSLTDSNAFSGTSTLPKNQSQITLENSNLTSSSQVYLSTLKGGKNQTLQLISKSDNSFTVGLSSPISEDIEFKWWIIN